MICSSERPRKTLAEPPPVFLNDALERAGANIAIDSFTQISYPELRKRILDHFQK